MKRINNWLIKNSIDLLHLLICCVSMLISYIIFVKIFNFTKYSGITFSVISIFVLGILKESIKKEKRQKDILANSIGILAGIIIILLLQGTYK